MSAYQPPLFKNLHKKAKDLFTKKVDAKKDFKNKLAVEHTTQDGLKVGTVVTLGDAITGRVDVGYKSGDYMFKANEDTTGDFSASVDVKNLTDGLVITGDVNQGGKTNKGSLTVGVAAEFVKEYVAVNGKFSMYKPADKVQGLFDGALALGYEGLTVGGNMKFDPIASKLQSSDVGFQYTPPTKGDFVFDVQTMNSGKSINVGYFHKLNTDHQIGVNFQFDKAAEVDAKGTYELAIANQYQIDNATSVKMVGSTTGSVLVGYEQKLSSPDVLFNVALGFDISGDAKLTPVKTGFKFTFGDN